MSVVVDTLAAMAEIYMVTLNKPAALLMLSDLEGYTEFQIMHALTRCRRELKRFPTVADILERIDDGRPGIEEAWGMVCKDEYSTIVWTEEMRIGYAACAGMIATDHVAARMAFKEAYERALNIARSNRVPVRWSVSLGQYVAGREPAIREAVSLGRLTYEQAVTLLPELRDDTKLLFFQREGEGAQKQISELIKDMIAKLPEGDRQNSNG